MKYKFIFTFIFLFAFLFSSSQKAFNYCSVDSDFFLRGISEFVYMDGVSINSYHEFVAGKVKFLAWGNKKPKIRVSRHSYIYAIIKLELHSNDDTGKDEIRIYSNGAMLFNYDFSDDFLEIMVNPSQISRLKFVVLNSTMKNKAAGSFEARIWIKGLTVIKK